jgi:hypothetical protein
MIGCAQLSVAHEVLPGGEGGGMKVLVGKRTGFVAILAALGIGATLTAALPASAVQPPAAADPAVITNWNAISVNTIAGAAPNGAGLNNAEGVMWFAFAQAAVYDAVEGITGDYALYDWNAKAPKGASPEAAAAVAAHDVLRYYFGRNATIAANLDAALANSLGGIPEGVPKDQGMRYGARAAERLIELRANDGRFAPITFDRLVVPGVWRPTPAAFAPFLDPWLSQVTPFTLGSDSQFRPGPPPAMDSAEYTQEFNEVRDYGSLTGSHRDAVQTDTALYFSRDIGAGPYQAGLRDLASRHQLNISDSARMFAAVDLSLADTIFAVWDSKYLYGKWRPITAIREADTDGNPDTAAVPNWTPLIPTPNYPDYVSGLSGVTGALSQSLARLNMFDLIVTSPVGTTRHYTDPVAMRTDVINARVWDGIHFRSADVAGATIGVDVANWAVGHYFAPTK